MNVDCIKVGRLRCNCYLLEKDGKYLLIDPGEELDKILKFIDGKDIIGILVTHHHFDHVDSLNYLCNQFGYSVYEYGNLVEGKKKIGPFLMEIIFTPGHTEDMVCYYFRSEKVMFTGDFLFRDTIGRCDLEGSSEEDMKNSIEKIKKYDDDIVIYPGHGVSTILGREKMYNPYF